MFLYVIIVTSTCCFVHNYVSPYALYVKLYLHWFVVFRLRMQRSELSVQSRAVTMIARYVRGYLQRGRYRLLLQRVQASTVIQAYIR